LGTEDSADDSNVVQICADGALYLYNTTRAAETAAGPTACKTVVLERAQAPSPETRDCVAVPDSEFRIKVVRSSDYLTGLVENDQQELTVTSEYNEAVPFRAAPGTNGQITLVSSANGRTLYSDQDLGGSGDGPIYFDDLGLSLTSKIVSETIY
jgi:hypothetical protein